MENLYSKFIIVDQQLDYSYISLYIGYHIYQFNNNLKKLDQSVQQEKLIQYYNNIDKVITKLNLSKIHSYIHKSFHEVNFLNLKDIPLRLSAESNIELKEDKYYEICPNFIYFYTFENNNFIILNHQESDTLSNNRNSNYIYNMIIYTTGTTKDFENLIEKSKEHYQKYISSNQNKTKIVAYTYDDGFWEKTNDKPKRSLENIYLPKKDKDEIIQLINNFRSTKTKKRYNILNKPYKLNILLEGKWGAGKTSLVNAIASEYDYPIYSISFNGNMSDVRYQRSYQSIPDQAIIIIEDIDGLAAKSRSIKTTTTTGDNNNNISFSGLLNTLDGIFSKSGVITFITTNYKDNLDEALIRPGRINYIMTFDYAKKSEIRKMYKRFIFVDELIDIEELDESDEKTNKIDELNIRSSEYSDLFYKEFTNLNIQIPLSYFEGYFWSYIGNPEKCNQNVYEIKEVYQKSNVEQTNLLSS